MWNISYEWNNKICAELKIRYVSNVIAVAVSITLAFFVGIVKPVMYYQTDLTVEVIYKAIILAFFSVLCTTLSFDKVKQAIDRLKGE